ncbi:Alpha-hemolysin translocation ATP-binding protein HlyB [Pseudoalteromonas sp. P1-9]|uniref:ABCB family ABC transporter ATP-binding protein/permease n=1 Tax=Pseudoalteromonas sp. P1-9 TaxID=1710354 RepID=UPI0006D626C2|nr:ABC transporter ATP-binding protein/permease [Pseudoalteromonas sp. P1-9]KPV97632.1 Alpha-hemolysin translocation ATP-binding protein HlyB [Pseudoalteromonas sp. P1-9]
MRRGFSVPNENDSFNIRVFKQVVPYLLEFRTRIIIAFCCLVFAKLASVYLPFVLKYTVDTLDQQNNVVLLGTVGLIAAYGVLRLANVVLSELRDMLFGRVTERAMRRISMKVFSHLQHLDLKFHLDRKTGGLARDIERGVSGISFVMRFFVFNIGPTLIELMLVIGILTTKYGAKYGLVIAASVVVYITFTVYVTNWRLKFIREANMADNRSNTRAVDSLLNFETVKYFNNEEHEIKEYDVELAAWEKARRKNRLSLFALNGGQALVIATAMTSMLLFAALDVEANAMTLGDFVLVNAFMMQIFMPLNFLGFVYREIKGSLTNIENMFDLLKVNSSVSRNSKSESLTVNQGAITFENVSFGYAKERTILNNLSLNIKAGSKVAIVGPSGSGKSTLTKLLCRFYDVTNGSIQIDGQNIAQVKLDSLREVIAVVPQDTVLFNASIYDNIHYGNLSATKEQVIAASEAANLKTFVESLNDGFETHVGERGLKLSGGEKQRVAIARALLKDSPIMVFDEATSALDSHNEEAIMRTIKKVARHHTAIMIAHRLSTVTDADHIFYLEQGQLVEEGAHQQLLEKEGRYAALWRSQSQ